MTDNDNKTAGDALQTAISLAVTRASAVTAVVAPPTFAGAAALALAPPQIGELLGVVDVFGLMNRTGLASNPALSSSSFGMHSGPKIALCSRNELAHLWPVVSP